MNISSLVEPVRGSEVMCLLDACASVDLRVFCIPFGVLWHWPGMAVPVVTIVILQSTQTAVLRSNVAPKMIVLWL
jgi:hypothetical protein